MCIRVVLFPDWILEEREKRKHKNHEVLVTSVVPSVAKPGSALGLA